MFKKFGILFVALVVVVIAASAYAFAAANTVPATKAGAGIGLVSGYTVTNVVYNLDAADATKLNSVEYDLSALATSARIKLLISDTAPWYECEKGTGNHWSCAMSPAVDFQTVTELNVIASDAAIPTPAP